MILAKTFLKLGIPEVKGHKRIIQSYVLFVLPRQPLSFKWSRNDILDDKMFQ